MEIEYNTILLEQGSDGIAGLTLNRPEKRKAITQEMIVEIEDALRILNDDASTRVIVVKGAGPAFCAGYDLLDEGGIDAVLQRDLDKDLEWIEWQASVFERLWRIRKPTIAQVHGYCLAGGAMVAGYCDVIVAAEDALIGQTRMAIPPELCL